MTLVSPPIHLVYTRMVTFLGIPGWAQKKWQDPTGLIWQLWAVVVCDCPLNCQSGCSRRQMSTYSQVGSVPTSVEESVGGG